MTSAENPQISIRNLRGSASASASREEVYTLRTLLKTYEANEKLLSLSNNSEVQRCTETWRKLKEGVERLLVSLEKDLETFPKQERGLKLKWKVN